MTDRDANLPDVFLGGHPLQLDGGIGAARKVTALAARVRPKGRSPRKKDQVYRRRLWVDAGAHLKTRDGWVIGWVPPGKGKDGRRPFYAGIQANKRKEKGKGYHTRYWGYVVFDGKKHYGWVDDHKISGKRAKKAHHKKLLPYSRCQDGVAARITRVWAYKRIHYKSAKKEAKNHALVKKPVNVFMPTNKALELYYNPILGKEVHLVGRSLEPRDVDGRTGVTFKVRWTGRGWCLVQEPGEGGDWVFLRQPKGAKLDPTRENALRSKTVRRVTL